MAESIPSSVEYLTTYDVQQHGEVHFSGCLIYDLESEDVVNEFVATMSRVNKDLIFFDPYKDMLWGCYEMDVLSQIIDERCGGRVLLFLPKAGTFTNEKMNFALQYTKHLDAIGKKRCLIPVRCYKDAVCSRLVVGIKEINMCESTKSQEYWETQSRQFRLSFSSNGPLRNECIRYNSRYNYHLDMNHGLQASAQTDVDCPCSYSANSQTQTEITPQETEHIHVESAVENIIYHQSKNDSSSISYQNTSLDFSQNSCKEGDKSTYSFAGDSIEGGKGTDEAVSVKEADTKVHSTNAIKSHSYMKKDSWKKKLKRWLSSSKKKAE
ncbi:hypothetical protein ACJMK2_022110 [Sinanodonta woodiana]|uniref:TIR domain-containing protein n=1 Tax=Sinanodonta woodiana TaxID=1069815 RepID=A0ABD3TI15_SINWO